MKTSSKTKGKRKPPVEGQSKPVQTAKPKAKKKTPIKGDVLSTRWKTDYYSALLSKLMTTKDIAKETQKIEGRYDFRNVNFRKMTLEGLLLKEACLSGLNGYSMVLDHCDLSGAFSKKGDFEEAHMIDSQCVGAVLSGCSLKKTHWTRVNFEGTIAENCDFTGANFVEINVENAILDNSNFSHLMNPENAKFVGVPKSTKNVIIDPETLASLPDSPFKQALLALLALTLK
jgi:uncharacterized protein YjbI with pentapeptide repeats